MGKEIGPGTTDSLHNGSCGCLCPSLSPGGKRPLSVPSECPCHNASPEGRWWSWLQPGALRPAFSQYSIKQQVPGQEAKPWRWKQVVRWTDWGAWGVGMTINFLSQRPRRQDPPAVLPCRPEPWRPGCGRGGRKGNLASLGQPYWSPCVCLCLESMLDTSCLFLFSKRWRKRTSGKCWLSFVEQYYHQEKLLCHPTNTASATLALVGGVGAPPANKGSMAPDRYRKDIPERACRL